MKKVLLFLLIALTVYLLAGLYFLDRSYFLCPIEYKGKILVRSDSRGDGAFAASRNGNRQHEGIDLLAEVGTPVLAARSARVVLSRVIKNQNIKTGSGNYIILQHPGGLVTAYGHLSGVYVHKNEFVRQGQVIGRVGKSGNANFPDIQPHLHFEVRKNGVPQDPMEYLE